MEDHSLREYNSLNITLHTQYSNLKTMAKSNIIFTSLLRNTISWYHCKSTWYNGFANFRNSGFHRPLVLKKLSLCWWYPEGHKNFVWAFLQSKSFVLSSYVCQQPVISLSRSKEEVCEKHLEKMFFFMAVQPGKSSISDAWQFSAKPRISVVCLQQVFKQ